VWSEKLDLSISSLFAIPLLFFSSSSLSFFSFTSSFFFLNLQEACWQAFFAVFFSNSLSPSFSKGKSKRNHRKGTVTLNGCVKQLWPRRKALIIPIKMLSQRRSKWEHKSQNQPQWRNTGGYLMITACQINISFVLNMLLTSPKANGDQPASCTRHCHHVRWKAISKPPRLQ